MTFRPNRLALPGVLAAAMVAFSFMYSVLAAWKACSTVGYTKLSATMGDSWKLLRKSYSF